MHQELGKCPDCQLWILIPIQGPTDDLVCPWCQHSLRGDIDRSPVRHVIRTADTGEKEAHPAAPAMISTCSQADSIATRRVSSRRTGAGKPRWHRVLVEPAKILAGGLAGLVIAQLILWWMPGTIARRDPLRLAPRMPVWLSVVVPFDLRPADAQEPNRDTRSDR